MLIPEQRIPLIKALRRLLAYAICILFWGITLIADCEDGSSTLEKSSNANIEQVLFPFDDYSIPFNSGLLMKLVHSRRPFDHAVVPVGKPGEPDSWKVQYYGTVIYLDGEYRMWYSGLDHTHEVICYATSTNGIDWVKPKLGLVVFNGNKDNNLVSLDETNLMNGATALVLYEPDEPKPERRFKMLREVSPMDMMAAFSSDGLHWKSAPFGPIIKGSPLEAGGLIKFNGCYIVNGHGGPIPHPILGAGKRMSITHISYDFEHWTQAAHIAFRRDPIPPRPPTDFEFHRGEQVHLGASLWNRNNVVLGFYGQYHNESNDRRTSTCDIGLIVSHDGLHFVEPVPDFKFIESFEEPDGADARLLQGQGFENIGDKTFYWYSVWGTTPDRPVGVRIATWQRDRFGYFSPGPGADKPQCLSSPFKLESGQGEIYVNADQLSSKCELRVELLTKELVPMPAYSGENCILVKKSGLKQRVSWKGRNSVDNVAEPFRIKVSWEGDRAEDGRLYAIYVREAVAHDVQKRK